MKPIAILAWSWMVFGASVQAATIVPIVSQEHIDVSIAELAYPDSLARDLMSGLENKLLIRATLLSNRRSIARVDALLSIKYDLWDEIYVVKGSVGDRKTSARSFKLSSELIAYLSVIKIEKLFSTESVPMDGDLIVQLELLMNPVEREKIDRLRKWVAANSAPDNAVGLNGTFTPKPNDLFNRIFEQYTQGADIAAPWRIIVVSPPFRVGGSGGGGR